MFAQILLLWIGIKLNAGTWYYVLLGISVFCTIVSGLWDMYKKGMERY